MPNCNILIFINKILGVKRMKGYYGVNLPAQEADDPLRVLLVFTDSRSLFQNYAFLSAGSFCLYPGIWLFY